jgi:two-component system NtrC family sensor kinase
MRIKWLSIRGRIIQGFLIGFLFMSLITMIHYLVVFRIHERLDVMETADELLNTILEMRRYEKNYFLYKERESYKANSRYTTEALTIFRDNAGKIIRTIGTEQYNALLRDLHKYQSLMKQIGDEPFSASRHADTESEIRKEGEKMVEVAAGIVSRQRLKTTGTLRHAQYTPLFFLAALAALAAYMIHLGAKKIVAPLNHLEQITKKLAKGDYSTLYIDCDPADEICHLITTFNNMVNELRQRQEEVLQSRKMAAIGTFTSGIAHELNNPINNIFLCVESYIRDYGTLSGAERIELLNDIYEQADRAAAIVRNLLEFSRPEKAALQRVSIEEIITSTVKLVKNQFALSGIKVDMAIPSDLPRVYGERNSLKQVFVNLFVNSAQAMHEGGKLTIEAKDKGDFIQIVVADTGPGIPPENLPRIFDPFFSTKEVGHGTGLGLSVTYGIIKKYRGDIQVSSTPGAGTTFTICLPKE